MNAPNGFKRYEGTGHLLLDEKLDKIIDMIHNSPVYIKMISQLRKNKFEEKMGMLNNEIRRYDRRIKERERKDREWIARHVK